MFAEPEAWFWQEVRLPLMQTAPVTDKPLQWRLSTDLRLGSRYGGLGGQFLRTGALWTVSPEWLVATQVAAITSQASPGSWDQEYRIELEPNQLGRWGDVVWLDRHRVEWRFRIAAGQQSLRYRNLFRVMWAPDGAAWMPFAWIEGLFDANPAGFAANDLGLAQIRSQAGVARRLGEATRLDLGLMIRSQFRNGNWAQDPVFNVALLSVPQGQPMVVDGAAGGD
ncbi:MAG: DUF2490 domain-containing protein [Candidatus Sericytochromatia bacterium]|nr:DUF2490 domain-containing protein [Candidatus Tanganyikabacteria bacterium]